MKNMNGLNQILAIFWRILFQKNYKGRLVYVNDGDTFVINTGGVNKTIRLAGIDAPETGQEMAYEAKIRLRQWLENRTLEITTVFWKSYRREVAIVKIIENGKIISVNDELVREGMAQVYGGYYMCMPYKFQRTLRDAAEGARINKAGIYTIENYITPSEYRMRNRKPC